MSGVELHGVSGPRFAAVKDAMAANFAEGAELGCRFTVVEQGETVLDLWAGSADRKGARATSIARHGPLHGSVVAKRKARGKRAP